MDLNIPTNITGALGLENLESTMFKGIGQQVQSQYSQQNQGFNQYGQNQGQGYSNLNQGFSQYNQQNQGFNQQQSQGYSQQNQGFNQYNNQQSQGYGQSGNLEIGNNIESNKSKGVMLKKGQKQSLSKLNSRLDLIQVALGWDLAHGGLSYDLDVEAFLLGDNERVIGDDWFVFYNQPNSPDGAVRLLGDSKDGSSSGDDEIIQVQLSRLNPQVSKIVFIVTINDAVEYGYNFSNVQNAYVRIVDCGTNTELVRFNLTDYYSNVCSMMVGELYSKGNEWRFNAIGNGTGDSLEGLCIRYGINVVG